MLLVHDLGDREWYVGESRREGEKAVVVYVVSRRVRAHDGIVLIFGILTIRAIC